MKKKFLLFFCLLGIFLTGCTVDQPANQEQTPPSLEQQESAESSPPAQPQDGLLYATDKLSGRTLPPKLSLFLGGDLVPVSENSQALLVGAALGAKLCALVEINGKGRIVEPGDLVGQYRIIQIRADEVELEHNKQ
jgi:hypothetical protein